MPTTPPPDGRGTGRAPDLSAESRGRPPLKRSTPVRAGPQGSRMGGVLSSVPNPRLVGARRHQVPAAAAGIMGQ
jgi:hypothetical protein